jgi:hypothetical protein
MLFHRKAKRPHVFTCGLSFLCRRRPTLPHTFACSTIGPAGLNFRVRDGNGCFPRGVITGKIEALWRRLSRQPKSRAFCARDLLRLGICIARPRRRPYSCRRPVRFGWGPSREGFPRLVAAGNQTLKRSGGRCLIPGSSPGLHRYLTAE